MSTVEKNWEKWLEIESKVRYIARRHHGQDEDDAVQTAAEAWLRYGESHRNVGEIILWCTIVMRRAMWRDRRREALADDVLQEVFSPARLTPAQIHALVRVEAYLNRPGCPQQLRIAIPHIAAGGDLGEAAIKVGWTASRLSKALDSIGYALTSIKNRAQRGEA